MTKIVCQETECIYNNEKICQQEEVSLIHDGSPVLGRMICSKSINKDGCINPRTEEFIYSIAKEIEDEKIKERQKKERQCDHKWVNRIDGWEEGCGPAICSKCGEYGCWCDVKYTKMTDEEKEEFRLNGISGNDHELEKLRKKKEI